ncbi:hypothetical protein ACQ86N_02630 [Puia sp. P3]|uniref:hypothetical protein n=1 Tax=Puia sp. P3 TaxID=3423952 RepID=UPI003D67C128
MKKLKAPFVAIMLPLGITSVTVNASNQIAKTSTDGQGNSLSAGWIESHCTGGTVLCANCYQDGVFVEQLQWHPN